jgi:hypothetical protein
MEYLPRRLRAYEIERGEISEETRNVHAAREGFLLRAELG